MQLPTRAERLRARRLKRADLPTLGRPTSATWRCAWVELIVGTHWHACEPGFAWGDEAGCVGDDCTLSLPRPGCHCRM